MRRMDLRFAIAVVLATACSSTSTNPGIGGSTASGGAGGNGATGATGGSTASCSDLKCPGAPCASAGECVNAHCVDGVCCNSDCTMPCRACLENDYGDGTCAYVLSGHDPRKECPSGQTCDGQGACK